MADLKDLLRKVEAALHCKNFETAENCLASVLQARPADPNLLRLYADVCQKTSAREKEWEALRHLLILEPANSLAAKRFARLVFVMGRQDTEGLINRAKRLNKEQKTETSWLKRALGRMPKESQNISATLPDLNAAQNREYATALQALDRYDHQVALAKLNPLRDAFPDNPDILGRLADALGGLMQYEKALAIYDSAVTHGGETPEILSSRIRMAIENGNLVRAENLFREIPESMSENTLVLVAEAALHRAHGRFEKAMDILDLVEARGDENANASAIRAWILAGQGSFEELERVLESWARRAPLSARPFGLAAHTKKLKPGTPLFAAAERLSENPRAAQSERANACFAIARAKEQAGDHVDAFKMFKRANMQVDVIYDAEQEDAEIAKIKSTMTPQVVARASTIERGKGLIFVCGLPRSGSTLAGQILSSHPEATSVDESQSFVACIRRAQAEGYPESADALSDEFCADLGQFYLDNLPEYTRQSQFVIDKELSKYKHLGLLRLALPGAKIVHTRRNAMDVCYSVYKQNFRGWPATYRLETMAHFHKCHDDIMAHWADVMPGEVHELRYEAIVNDPEEEIKALLAAVDMPFHSDCLNFHQAKSSVKTASIFQVRQKVYGSSVGAWKRHETELEPLREALNAA